MKIRVYHITVQTSSEGIIDYGFYTDWDKVDKEMDRLREDFDIPEDDNESSDGTTYIDIWDQKLEIEDPEIPLLRNQVHTLRRALRNALIWAGKGVETHPYNKKIGRRVLEAGHDALLETLNI